MTSSISAGESRKSGIIGWTLVVAGLQHHTVQAHAFGCAGNRYLAPLAIFG